MKGMFLIVAVMLLAASAVSAQDAIGTEITSITTVSVAGEASMVENAAGNSQFDGAAFTLNFLGLTERITAFEVDGMTISVEGAVPATATLRRNPDTDTRDVLWYLGNFAQATSTFTFAAAGGLTANDLLQGNNILAGVDNLFVNEGASVGETPFNGNASIERIDYVLEAPVTAAETIGFVVFERGAFDGHDGFGIAAITAVDEAGSPTAFGPLYQIPSGWGQTILAHYAYFVLNNGADGSGGTPTSPTLQGGPQQLGGILFRTTELVEAGTEVFGYALVGPDVTCTSEELLDVTAACYPTNTGNPGGLDIPDVNLGAVTLGM